jgi:hypothetical protein
VPPQQHWQQRQRLHPQRVCSGKQHKLAGRLWVVMLTAVASTGAFSSCTERLTVLMCSAAHSSFCCKDAACGFPWQ